MVAAKNGHDSVLTVLIKGGAKLELKDAHGWTALMFAANNDHVECVKELLKSGANPNAIFYKTNYSAISNAGKVTQATVSAVEFRVLDIAKPRTAEILKSYGAQPGGKRIVLRDDFGVFKNK